jgi:hypothetical protein
MADLSKVSIGIKTLLRDEMLADAVSAACHSMPQAEIVIADDGRPSPGKNEMYEALKRGGHQAEYLPFDSGFGFKSNWIAQHFRRDYLLVASDDFDFRPPEVVRGIEKLVDVLDRCPIIDIASGRVNGYPYEFDLEDLGDTIIEHPVPIILPDENLWFVQCDLTVNYSLIRRRVFEKVSWESAKWCPIGGGEHGQIFILCKRLGFKTVYVPGVNINTQKDKMESAEYKKCRARANSSERPYFDKIGVKKYILGNGVVDYNRL